MCNSPFNWFQFLVQSPNTMISTVHIKTIINRALMNRSARGPSQKKSLMLRRTMADPSLQCPVSCGDGSTSWNGLLPTQRMIGYMALEATAIQFHIHAAGPNYAWLHLKVICQVLCYSLTPILLVYSYLAFVPRPHPKNQPDHESAVFVWSRQIILSNTEFFNV